MSVQVIMKAILSERHPDMLHENGGPLKLSKWFCKAFVRRHMNWSFRKATTAAQKLPKNWAEQVENMNKRLSILVYDGKIPRELMFSMDETFCFFVPMGNSCTLAERGTKVILLAIAMLSLHLICHTKRGGGWQRRQAWLYGSCHHLCRWQCASFSNDFRWQD